MNNAQDCVGVFGGGVLRGSFCCGIAGGRDWGIGGGIFAGEAPLNRLKLILLALFMTSGRSGLVGLMADAVQINRLVLGVIEVEDIPGSFRFGDINSVNGNGFKIGFMVGTITRSSDGFCGKK